MNMVCRRLPWILAALVIMAPSIATAQMADKKSSPFESLRWNDDLPEVMVRSDWHRPLEIQGVDVDEVLEFCKKRYGSRARKRFGEDLPMVFMSMGHPFPSNVTLKLQRIQDGRIVTLTDVPSTKANRRAIWSSNQATREEVETRDDSGILPSSHARRLWPISSHSGHNWMTSSPTGICVKSMLIPSWPG